MTSVIHIEESDGYSNNSICTKTFLKCCPEFNYPDKRDTTSSLLP